MSVFMSVCLARFCAQVFGMLTLLRTMRTILLGINTGGQDAVATGSLQIADASRPQSMNGRVEKWDRRQEKAGIKDNSRPEGDKIKICM
jgi:hypothetical protein